MNKYKLYTAELIGASCGYEMVIITKWKDTTEDSPEEGHKAYYFTPDYGYLNRCIKDENWCRGIYEMYPQYTKFKIERKIELNLINRGINVVIESV